MRWLLKSLKNYKGDKQLFENVSYTLKQTNIAKEITKINLIVTEKWLKLGKIKGIFAKRGKLRNKIMQITAYLHKNSEKTPKICITA